MDILLDFLLRVAGQFQSPSLAFLIGGILVAACGSKLQIPDAVYQFAVFMLLMRIGIKGGMEIRDAELSEMVLPALAAAGIGAGVVERGDERVSDYANKLGMSKRTYDRRVSEAKQEFIARGGIAN